MKLRDLISKTKMKMDEKVIAASIAVGTALAPINAYAATSYKIDNLTGDKVYNGMVSLVSTIGKYAGGLMAVGGVFGIVMAMRNEDPEGRNKAILVLVAAIAFLNMGNIIKAFLG